MLYTAWTTTVIITIITIIIIIIIITFDIITFTEKNIRAVQVLFLTL